MQTEKDPIPEAWEVAEEVAEELRVSRDAAMMLERQPLILNGDQAEKNFHE